MWRTITTETHTNSYPFNDNIQKNHSDRLLLENVKSFPIFSPKFVFFFSLDFISFHAFSPLFLSFSRSSVRFSVQCHCRICALFHVINISDTLYVICASEMPLIFAIPFPVLSNKRKKGTTLEYENFVGLSFSRYGSVFFLPLHPQYAFRYV